jgi:hypothetical protein
MSCTFLVENYVPGLSVDGLQAVDARVCAEAAKMAREGKAVRVVRSTIVPEDEALLCLLDADSEELVREAYDRAGVTFDRISKAISS